MQSPQPENNLSRTGPESCRPEPVGLNLHDGTDPTEGFEPHAESDPVASFDPASARLVGAAKRTRRMGTIGVLALTCTFGMLIWVKLRVVESVPRQAYAEPRHAGERAPAGFKQGMAPAAAQRLPGHPTPVLPAPVTTPDPIAAAVPSVPGPDPSRGD